ncbi:MAG: AraC family transcriptional regulator [Saprospiraceae bacterium]|nr:AraC family transcriptional regulator [Saprospiraceae bacterium]
MMHLDFLFLEILAFAGMLLWLGYAVFREDIQLFLETRRLKPQSDLSALVEDLETTLQHGHLLSNPELGTLHLAKVAACGGKYIRESVWQHRKHRVSAWIQELRIEMAQQMLQVNSDMHHVAIAAGFNSTHQLIKVLQQKAKKISTCI